ncbi:MAG: cell division protein FtsQ/DivIB [Actinomycetota bacterium]
MKPRIEGARYHRSPGAAVALTVVVLALGVWTVVASPLFAVKRIDVTGARYLQQEAVRQLAGVPLGTNVLRVPVEEATRSLVKHPWIAWAEVSRNLPAGITISVRERRPVGWVTDTGGAALLSADATVLDVQGSPPPDLPSLGDADGSLAPGAGVPGSPALSLAASMPASLLDRTEAVREVLGELIVDLRTGERVSYGALGDLEAKNHAVVAMLSWAEERGVGIQAIDVSIPQAPTLSREAALTAG